MTELKSVRAVGREGAVRARGSHSYERLETEQGGKRLGCDAVKHIFGSCTRGRARSRAFPLRRERKARLRHVSVRRRGWNLSVLYQVLPKEWKKKQIRHSNINTRRRIHWPFSHESAHATSASDWFPYLGLVGLRGAAAFVALWVCVGRWGVCAQVGLRGQASAVLLTPW